MPPSGNYLLCIAPAAARVTENKRTIKKFPLLLAIPMAVAVCWYNTMKYALVGERIGGWYSISKVRCRKEYIALKTRY
jgi:hypothetical protein